MLYEIKDKIISLVTSRLFILYLMLITLSFILIHKIFVLQIVDGQQYEENFTLKSEKEISLPSTRGNIYDRNGKLLAYNDLAYMITITDTIESGSGKNQKLNDIIYRTSLMIKEGGDTITSDFAIYLDENDNYCFSISGNELLRFLADIYGKSSINDLEYEEKNANPDTVIAYLASSKKYGVGLYMGDENTKDSFVPMMGYTKEEVLDIIKVRYNLSLNTYQKYISTTISTQISDKTIAIVMENISSLEGVEIKETNIRKYNDSVYFSPIIGYTGKISKEELEEYADSELNYDSNDYVGKTGIEYSMESQLQGMKGHQTLYVDNLGRIIETKDTVNPSSGNDIYLTIDADLQKACYNLLEQKIAGIIVNKLVNDKVSSKNGRNKEIPIYDVYYALINNNVINLNHMTKSYAGDYEKQVNAKFDVKMDSVTNNLKTDVLYSDTPYKELNEENQVYESFIISMISSPNYGILIESQIDTSDEIYNRWKVAEDISIHDYLMYAISQQWIDTSKLDLDAKYSDSSEVYDALVDYIIDHLKTNSDFAKKLYKYMIFDDTVSGREICMILWEQDIIQVPSSDITALKSGSISSYQFMRDLISNIKVTPAMLGLEPCSGSIVVTDPNNGEVLALVSYPGYDNNKLANNADSKYLAKLNNDMSKPLWNYATQQRTAPGSTFKIVTSVAGVEEGVISTSTVIECNGIFDKLNGTIHKCWISPGRHGNMTLRSAIANSCNVFFYETGYRLANDGTGYNDQYGIERLAKYVEMFGLSERSGVEISESEPQVSDQYPVASAIGQGTHSYTTVGLARYVSAVANNGTVYELSLIHAIKDSKGNDLYTYTPEIRNQITLSQDLWNNVHYGMRDVITSKKYYADYPIACAGKTGTAQESANKPNHALFIGYAPFDNPEIAIATRVANGYSSDYAAQIAKDVFTYYFKIKDTNELITGTASEAVVETTGD